MVGQPKDSLKTVPDDEVEDVNKKRNSIRAHIRTVTITQNQLKDLLARYPGTIEHALCYEPTLEVTPDLTTWAANAKVLATVVEDTRLDTLSKTSKTAVRLARSCLREPPTLSAFANIRELCQSKTC